ncbi:MAG: flagellar export chaperone FlgN [Firmicutes bacterium]|nr:flagellar export chaperone FlgN [Bacillota bacterium]
MEKFKEIIRQTITAIKQFTEIEQVKLKAAAESSITTVESCMTREQSMVLRVRGLDNERTKWQESNGYGGLTFRQILDKVSPEEKTELQPLFDELSDSIKLFQDVRKSAEQIIRTNLYVVNKKLEEQGRGYNKDGSSDMLKDGFLTNSKA